MAMACVASTLGAYAQSTNNGVLIAPFAVGNGFAASILSINLPSFFNGSNRFAGGNDLGPGTAPTAAVTGNTGTVFNRSNVLAYQYSSNTTDYTTTEPVVVLTGLIDSTNVRTGSAGVVIGNIASSTVNSLSFQYSPMSLQTGLVVSDFLNAPYVVIVDDGGTRYLPITSGTVVSNFALNQFNGLNKLGVKASTATNNNATVLSNAFISVSFNSAQLGVQGTVRRVGLVIFRRGLTLVNNITVNGQTTSAIVAGSLNTYPF